MRVLNHLQDIVEQCSKVARPLGLVPTMGALHQGHLSLVRQARRDNPTVVATVFVNPTQFGPREDFATYTRDMDRDLALLEEERVDLVFAPDVGEMYPPGFDTFVEVERTARRLEGEQRPGHFRGVATIVTKLLIITRPDRAYFGQKDGQQVAVIKRLNRDLHLGVDIVVLPTVREADGLALSSRNAYLDATQRQAATVLYRALCAAKDRFCQGERDAERLRQAAWEVLREESLASPEYVSVADPDTMEELDRVDHSAMVSLAVRIGEARLIDNVLLHE